MHRHSEQAGLFRPRAPLGSRVTLDSVEGFGPRLIARVRARWPRLLEDSELRDNPYLLTELGQIGFRLADRAALAVGVGKTSKARQQAAAVFVLSEAEQQGNTCLPIAEFAARFTGLLGAPLDGAELDDRVAEADGMLGLRRTFNAEDRAAEIVRGMVKNEGGVFRDPTVYDGLADDQRAALTAIQRNQIFCLLGSPGTGKTTAIRAVLASNPSLRVALCAPTGKAAKRIEELTGRPASTIHRLLEPEFMPSKDGKPGRFRFRRGASNPLPHDLVVCDETSMVDTRLFSDLLVALRPDARLLLVGDIHQLPSVGPGRVLGDLRTAVESVELSTLKRQDPALLIARNCARIRDGESVMVDNASAQDFFFLPARTEQEIADLVVEVVTKRLPQKYELKPEQIMILTARRDKTALSAAALNVRLRAVLNPDVEVNPFAVGDRVIQLRNDYELGVFNGEVGTVTDTDGASYITVDFELPDREVTIPLEDRALAHAWALTTHKAQGSEWPWVVIPVHRSNGVMVPVRSWIYTAISRGKNGVVVVGDRQELDAIVFRVKEQQRWTRLGALLASP